MRRILSSVVQTLRPVSFSLRNRKRGIEQQWSICEKIMKGVPEFAIGKQGPPQRNDWFDDEGAAATSLKNRHTKIC